MSASNSVSWRYITEVTFGTTPGTPTMIEVMRTGGTLDGKTDTVTSKAVRSDRQVQGFFRTGQHAEGSIEVEMAYAQFDDLMQAALCGTWTTAVAYSGNGAGGISAAAADDSINTSGDFSTLGTGPVVAGMWLKFAGFTDPANNGIGHVLAVTATKLTFDGWVSDATSLFTAVPAFVDEAATTSVHTMRNAGMLRNGTTGRSFTWEQAHTDVSQYFQFRGMRLNDWSINISAKALITGTFSWMGKSFTRDGSTIASVVTAPNDNDAFNTTEDVIALHEGVLPLTEYVSSITLSAKNNLAMIDAVGNLTPPDVTYGVMDVTGELNIYFASTSGTIVDKYINFTETGMSFIMKNLTATGVYSYYVVTIPAYKYSGGIPEAGALSGQSMCKLPFSAYKGSGGFQLQIDKFTTS